MITYMSHTLDCPLPQVLCLLPAPLFRTCLCAPPGQAVLAERETKLAAAEEAARAATVAARDRAAAAQSAQQEVERAMTAQRQQLEQVSEHDEDEDIFLVYWRVVHRDSSGS